MAGETIEVYAVGSEFFLNGKSARITAVSVRGNGHVQYEAVWWDNGTRHCEWLTEGEIGWVPGNKRTIGFRPIPAEEPRG